MRSDYNHLNGFVVKASASTVAHQGFKSRSNQGSDCKKKKKKRGKKKKKKKKKKKRSSGYPARCLAISTCAEWSGVSNVTGCGGNLDLLQLLSVAAHTLEAEPSLGCLCPGRAATNKEAKLVAYPCLPSILGGKTRLCFVCWLVA